MAMKNCPGCGKNQLILLYEDRRNPKEGDNAWCFECGTLFEIKKDGIAANMPNYLLREKGLFEFVFDPALEENK
jgi:hypothetical protein